MRFVLFHQFFHCVVWWQIAAIPQCNMIIEHLHLDKSARVVLMDDCIANHFSQTFFWNLQRLLAVQSFIMDR